MEKITAFKSHGPVMPHWINADDEKDISDIWVEECDPENADGYVVKAYIIDGMVEGISITDLGDTNLYHRYQAIEMMGVDAITRIDASHISLSDVCM